MIRPARAGNASPESTGPCPGCGAPLQDDQEWCLECGAARTVIPRAPDWRIAAAIVVFVIVVVVVAVVIVLP